jgi:hypothetical protein
MVCGAALIGRMPSESGEATGAEEDAEEAPPEEGRGRLGGEAEEVAPGRGEGSGFEEIGGTCGDAKSV